MSEILLRTQDLSTPIDRRNITDNQHKINQAQLNMTNGAKYTDRQSLVESGLASKYDELQNKLVNIELYKKATTITRTRLEHENTALDSLNKIMVNFESVLSKPDEVLGTRADKADSALADIEELFRQRDHSGRYIWGGKDRETDPLSKIDQNGRRVQTSLLDESNVEKKMILNNYSDSTENSTLVTISSEHDVRESFIHPSHPAIAKAIGYLNMMKESATGEDSDGNPVVYTDHELEAAQKEQQEARMELKCRIDSEIKDKVNLAPDVNKNDMDKVVKENAELFTSNIIEKSQILSDLILSQAVLLAAQNIQNNLTKQLLNIQI